MPNISKSSSTLGTAHGVLTPYAIARFSEDLYLASLNYTPDRPMINYYLFAVSIEIGLKSAILSIDCTEDSKTKIKELGHDLSRLVDCYQAELGRDYFSCDEQAIISQINQFYRDKSLEYFTTPMLRQALLGFKDFPPLEELSMIAGKVNMLLKDNDYYTNAKTSETTGKGIVTLH